MEIESKPQESLPDTRPVPVCVVPYTDQNDEVSLIDLWRVIVSRKNLILLCFLTAIMLAYAYTHLAEPSYRAEVYLLPPQQQNIQGLLIDYREIGGLEIERYTPDLVYTAFLKKLNSQGLRREFFDTYNLSTHYKSGKSGEEDNLDQVFDKFNTHLMVEADNQNTAFMTVRFINRDPKLAAQWLNQFIVFANEHTVDQLLIDVKAAIRVEIERVRYQLDSKLKLAEQRRRDSITSLREALRVARALGIENTSILSMRSNKNQAEIAVNTAEMPLYMRGAKALETEIVVLESRKSDEPFILGLRDLQEKLVFLEGVLVDRDMLSAVTIDAGARVPHRLEKPRKMLVLILAAIFGLMVGIFLVFIAEFRSKVRA